MRLYLSVLAAAWPALSDADTGTQAPSGLIRNSSNVFNGNLSRLAPFDKYNAPARSLPAPQRRWHPEEPIPEPADDDDWDYYVSKGRRLVAHMSYSDFSLAQIFPDPKTTMQSPYGYKSLKKWGYTMHRVSKKYRNFKDLGIANFLKRMGISDKCREEGGTWIPASIMHGDPDGEKWVEEQKYKGPDGKIRRMTGARIHMAVTPEGGIMTQYRESPWVALQHMHPKASATGLPHMQASSDIMWAIWEHSVPYYLVTEVKFFITISITNPTTLALIRRALNSKRRQLTTDGTKFYMGTDEGNALLASPNGAGFAHLLIERKLQVGLKTIAYVWVIQCEDSMESACMVFGVKNLHFPSPPPGDE